MIVGPPRRVRDAAQRITHSLRLDPRLFLRMLGWRLAVPVLKRFMTVATLADFMRARSASVALNASNVERIRQMTSNGGRMLVSRNCLTRSLVLYRLLSRAGGDPVLLLGAKQDDDRTAGHAWIEVGGQPFPGPDEEIYEPLVRFSSRGVEPVPSGRLA